MDLPLKGESSMLRGDSLQEVNRGRQFYLLVGLVAVFSLWSCATTTAPAREEEKPPGFFARFLDQITERECNVAKFTCPYGLGPAGEPCTCTDPSGYVLGGRTVK